MGNVINTISVYISNFCKRIIYNLEIHGMTKAADELHRLGYRKEYEELIDRLRNTKYKL
jgi:hypothetical protein